MSSVRSFVELFSLSPSPLAPTGAPPIQRLPILVEALRSAEPRRQRLALLACEEALRTNGAFRVVSAEPKGLRPGPHLWSPATFDEIVEAYRQVWVLVREHLDLLEGHEQRRAAHVLIRRARDIVQIHALSDLVLETLHDLSTRSFVDRRDVIEQVEEIIRYETRTLPSELGDRWRALRDELVDDNFATRLQRYVGIALIDDDIDDQGNLVNTSQHILERLAAQAVEQPALLDSELDWLLAGDAPAGLAFGYEIGKRDSEQSLLPRLLDRLRELSPRGNGFLLSGYLRILAAGTPERWEDLLDHLADDEQLRALVPELTWRVRLTDRAAWRILDLARNGVISTEQFAMFGVGGVIRSISEEPLHAWLGFLLNAASPNSIASALQILFYYYVYDRKDSSIPEDLTWRALTQSALFQDGQGMRPNSSTARTWQRIATRFLDQYPQRSLELSGALLERMQKDSGIISGPSPPAFAVLNYVLRADAAGVWKQVAPLLGPPIDTRAYWLGVWLHGTQRILPNDSDIDGALTRIPDEAVWAWVDEDVERRAWLVANLAPGGFFRENDKVCWSREVLVRYGDRDDVRRNIGIHFGVESWRGPESEHWAKKRAELLEYRRTEDHPRVLRWIDDYVEYLDQQIERARTEEEREW